MCEKPKGLGVCLLADCRLHALMGIKKALGRGIRLRRDSFLCSVSFTSSSCSGDAIQNTNA